MKFKILSLVLALLFHAGIFGLLHYSIADNRKKTDPIHVRIIDKIKTEKKSELTQVTAEKMSPKKIPQGFSGDQKLLSNISATSKTDPKTDPKLSQSKISEKNGTIPDADHIDIRNSKLIQGESNHTEHLEKRQITTDSNHEPQNPVGLDSNRVSDIMCKSIKIPLKLTGQNLFPRSYQAQWSKELKTVKFIPLQNTSYYLDKKLQQLYVKCVENSGHIPAEISITIQFVE